MRRASECVRSDRGRFARKDYVGVRLGLLLVIASDDASDRLVVRCDCGVQKTLSRRTVQSKSVRTCGCGIKNANRARTRPATRSPAWRSWVAMRRRCDGSNRPDFKHYGGRGIAVCERWASFENFLTDMGQPPPGTSLDRINNDGNYEPGNCRWATAKEQRANQRKARPARNTRWVLIGDQRVSVADAARILGIPRDTMTDRLRRGRIPGVRLEAEVREAGK